MTDSQATAYPNQTKDGYVMGPSAGSGEHCEAGSRPKSAVRVAKIKLSIPTRTLHQTSWI
jgi:hypothetical protein